ncbi:Cytosol non-specific dipeptidase [invertebrate metagenome]|uniref:Cytosol non-specific dipeptidase n=1 Tax=invertebrate metagenome TaxID=1711999 RepID=A0A2H9T7S6_9ZZZZ
MVAITFGDLRTQYQTIKEFFISGIVVTQINMLEPKPVWSQFDQILQIPRPSKHEEAISNHLQAFAEKHHLECVKDEVGNVIIRKPATKGMEDCKGVILQAHMDMVPQKNSDTEHDFLKDSIKAYQNGEWVLAEGTTLGADDGIGIAAALAVLASSDIQHGPLEVLCTVDEETGMTGAEGLKAGVLQGSVLLNLDSEEDGELCIGCAGGIDIVIKGQYTPEAVSDDKKLCKISLTGLKGGHSGQDINRGRGNANKLMVRLLKTLSDLDSRVVSFHGGSLRNAIAREAFVTIAVDTDKSDLIAARIDECQSLYCTELGDIEPDLSLIMTAVEREGVVSVMPQSAQENWLNVLDASPVGVQRMSTTVEGVVETSNNMAMICIEEGSIQVDNMSRSLIDSAIDDLAERIAGVYRVLGAEVSKLGRYPGWRPNAHSPILEQMKQTHVRLFGEEPVVKVIHAGLECGLLGSLYPEWDMISFGPTILGAHSPDEKVNIQTVEKFWTYLVDVLQNISRA